MTYDQVIKASATVLVEFYASWCPHCKRMMPIVAQIKEILAGSVSVFQFDIDQHQELAGEQGVESIPTFIIYKEGREVWRQSGEMEGNVLLAKLEQYI